MKVDPICNNVNLVTRIGVKNDGGSQNPLAKWARVMEIIIPAYMLGKSWGIAQPRNLELFKAQFPSWIIEITQWMKGLLTIESVELQRLIATSSGAVIGFFMILAFAVLLHFLLRDRPFIDSLRFTAVTSLPIAIMNGILSHGLQTLLDNSTVKTVQALTVEAVYTPWGYFVLNLSFYLASLWFMGKRTGVAKPTRYYLLGAGVFVMGLYLAAGLMILPGEWQSIVGHLL